MHHEILESLPALLEPAPLLVTQLRHCTPVSVSHGGCSFQFGRASAPKMPHRVHTMRGPSRNVIKK
jgi:hypothetical protein